jgi:hypothetical protein
MRLNPRSLALIAALATAIAPAAAVASTDTAPTSGHASMTCGKDYSRNSVDGNYCVSAAAYKAPVAQPTSASPTPVAATNDSGFAWGEAGAGAGGAIVLVALGAGGVVLLRRRHGPSTPDERRSPATG